MFKELYFGELKKLLKIKTLLVFSIIILLFFVLSVFTYNLDFYKLPEDGKIAEGKNVEIVNNTYTADTIVVYIQASENAIKELKIMYKNNKSLRKSMNDQLYVAKVNLAAYKYIQKHEIYDKPVTINNGQSSIISIAKKDALGFVTIALSGIIPIIMIYGISIGSAAYANEIKAGTLKIVLMRPITRNKLTLAKTLASLTIVTAFTVATTLLIFTYAAIAYPFVNNSVLYVFNATSAYMGTVASTVVVNIFNGLILIWAYTLLALAIGTVTKNRTAGVIIPLVISFGILAMPLSMIYLGKFLFSTSLGFLGFLTEVGYGIYYGSNFFLSLGLFIFYMTIIVGSTFVIFKKRDVA